MRTAVLFVLKEHMMKYYQSAQMGLMCLIDDVLNLALLMLSVKYVARGWPCAYAKHRFADFP